MRRVSSPLRQLVQSRLNTHTLPHLRRLDEFPSTSLHRSIDLGVSLAYSTLPSLQTADGFTKLRLVAAARRLFDQLPTQPYQRAPQSAHYGKWESLSHDKERLLFEADVAAPDQQPPLRLVDLPENQNDFQLWLCILDFRCHRDGWAGAAAVMDGLMARGSLTEVEGELAVVFWKTLLAHACPHEEMLDNACSYAEWLYDKFGLSWPNLHDTVISFFVHKHDRIRALRWHLRLSPNLSADAETFAAMLKQLMDPAPERQEVLRMLYLTSPHRCLYDRIIPSLYSEGYAEMARQWRQLLTANGDVPHSSVSRPFLQYISTYYPGWELEPGERAVAEFQVADEEATHEAKPTHLDLRYMVNAAHGEVFGIKAKTYNDELGARWFATSWVSIDSAINSLYMLGITSIGPLSLQSIALRELTAHGLARRIDQLETQGISVGNSTYAQALCRWAASGKEDMILDLIHSDMHPDVFDEPPMQRSILLSAMKSGDVSRSRLIVAAQVDVAEDLTTRWFNEALLSFLVAGDKFTSLKVLDTMHRRGIRLSLPTVRGISRHVRRMVFPFSKSRLEDAPDVLFYACLCSMITTMFAPPSVEALRNVFYQLHHQGRIDEFMQLARDVTGYYQRRRATGHGFLPVLEEEVPERLRKARDQTPSSGLRHIPHDLMLNHSLHPLSLIFDQPLQRAIVTHSFASYDLMETPNGPPPAKGLFRYLDGVRLIRWLAEQGVIIYDGTLHQALIRALANCNDRSLIFRSLLPRRILRWLTPERQRFWALQAFRQIIHQILARKFLFPSTAKLALRIRTYQNRTRAHLDHRNAQLRRKKSSAFKSPRQPRRSKFERVFKGKSSFRRVESGILTPLRQLPRARPFEDRGGRKGVGSGPLTQSCGPVCSRKRFHNLFALLASRRRRKLGLRRFRST